MPSSTTATGMVAVSASERRAHDGACASQHGRIDPVRERTELLDRLRCVATHYLELVDDALVVDLFDCALQLDLERRSAAAAHRRGDPARACDALDRLRSRAAFGTRRAPSNDSSWAAASSACSSASSAISPAVESSSGSSESCASCTIATDRVSPCSNSVSRWPGAGSSTPPSASTQPPSIGSWNPSRSPGSPSGSPSIPSSSSNDGRLRASPTSMRSTRPACSWAAINASRKPYQTNERVAASDHWSQSSIHLALGPSPSGAKTNSPRYAASENRNSKATGAPIASARRRGGVPVANRPTMTPAAAKRHDDRQRREDVMPDQPRGRVRGSAGAPRTVDATAGDREPRGAGRKEQDEDQSGEQGG